jgi:hypothetical protein
MCQKLISPHHRLLLVKLVMVESMCVYLINEPLLYYFVQEINAILGEKLSAEDEEDVLAEFESLEAEVCFNDFLFFYLFIFYFFKLYLIIDLS